MKKLLLLALLVVGLFSQEEEASPIRFNPETGEIINSDSTIKDIYPIIVNEIWQKEIEI